MAFVTMYPTCCCAAGEAAPNQAKRAEHEPSRVGDLGDRCCGRRAEQAWSRGRVVVWPYGRFISGALKCMAMCTFGIVSLGALTVV